MEVRHSLSLLYTLVIFLSVIQLATAIYIYYICKLLEFADTAFFIIRKKNSQVTFLHVYHHGTMAMYWWIGVKWYAGGLGEYIQNQR